MIMGSSTAGTNSGYGVLFFLIALLLHDASDLIQKHEAKESMLYIMPIASSYWGSRLMMIPSLN